MGVVGIERYTSKNASLVNKLRKYTLPHQLQRLTQQAYAWNQWTNTVGKNKEFQLQQEWIWSPPGERYRTKKKAEQKEWKKYQNVSTLQVICYEYKFVVQEPTKTPW